MEGPVRLIAHRQVQPGLFIYNAFIMGKGVKPGLSVISAHAAFAKTAESHLRSSKMNDGVVDTSAAKAAAGGDFFCRCFVRGKEIKSQRMRHGVDSGDHFFQIVEYQHGHEGTEDLFLHHRIGKSNIIKDSGFNAQSLSVRDASVDHFLFIDQPQDPVKVFFIDDLPVIRILQRLAAVLEPDLFLYFFEQAVFYGAVAVNVIRGYAGLAAVEIFSKGQYALPPASDQRSDLRCRGFFPQAPG